MKNLQLLSVSIGFIWFYIINIVQPAYTSLWNETWTDKLKRDLLLKYDKFARPSNHYNATIVYFDMTVFHVSVDSSKSAMSAQSWVRMAWKDEKLKWNSSEYGGLNKLQLGSHEVWQPDIILYNSVAVSPIEHYGDIHIHIYNDGSVLWVPPTQFVGLCDLDFRLWPFDSQTCPLKLGSWTYSGNEIDLRLREVSFTEKEPLDNSEWKLIDLTRLRNITTYECCPDEPYIFLLYTLTIKRNSSYYTSIFITPATVIVILCLVNFWLPSDSKEKLILSGFTALITSIFLIYFAHRIPPYSSSPPLIVSFYSGCLYQVTISLVISAIVINLSRKPFSRPLPRNLKKVLIGWPGKYLGLSDLIQGIQQQFPSGEQELRENHAEDTSVFASNILSNNGNIGDRDNIIPSIIKSTQLEWILAATAIDRISFLIFCNIFAIMAMTFM